MKILGIETSCDETSAAIVENGFKVISQSLASSKKFHNRSGGIIPEQAAREQVKSIIPIIKKTIEKSGLNFQDINALAVTNRPGLIGSLLVGLETAKTLSFVWQKPLVPVNHILGHIYANFLGQKPILPALCLVVSGKTTSLILIKSHQQFKTIGHTLDDAAGECFDKCSRALGLSYPGGPAIEKAAKNASPSLIKKCALSFSLPRPMINQNNFNFSFSGLKTALSYILKKNQKKSADLKAFLAWETQKAITDILVKKTILAAEKFQPKSILIGGGVARNQKLRNQLKKILKNGTLKLYYPEKQFCSDNAAMIASAAFFNYKPIHWSKIKPNPSSEILSF